jgi:hypothetical protein
MRDYGAERLETLLPLLETAIRDAGLSRLLDRLRPGVPEHVTRDRFEAVGLHAPKELQTWFAWSDGSDGQVIPYQWFCSQEELFGLYPHLDIGEFFGQWRLGWVPWVNTIAAYCGQPDADLAPVQKYSPDDGGFERLDPHAVAEPSLCVPVSWWIEHFQKGIYAWDAAIDDWVLPVGVPRDRRHLA